MEGQKAAWVTSLRGHNLLRTGILVIRTNQECWVLLFVSAVIGICSALLGAKGIIPLRASGFFSNLLLLFYTWFFIFAYLTARRLYEARPKNPLTFIIGDFFDGETGKKLLWAAPMLLALAAFLPVFSAMKSAIPLFKPYSFDVIFIDWDRALHGADPWMILHPVVGQPLITSGLSLLYHLWIMLIYGGGIYFAVFEGNPLLRVRFFAGYFAIWTFIGMCLAISFSSVGPCFLEPMLGNSHFSEQMAYLYKADESFPVLVLDVQEQLLAWHRTGNYGLGRGITAMPSMHVALSVLFFLVLRNKSTLLGRLFGVYAIMIFVGSVHLGYHYAVDGYIAALATLLIWIIVCLLFRERRIRESVHTSTSATRV